MAQGCSVAPLTAILLIGATFAVARCATSAPSPVSDRPTPPSLSLETRKGCSAAIAKAQSEGLVRERPNAVRANVDELRWAAIPATEKTALLSLLACDGLGKQAAEMTMSDAVPVVYGYRTGKRLALLSPVGPSFE